MSTNGPLSERRPLTIVSNRGPAEFGLSETGERVVRRGGGGLVTALSGLATHRKALWIASAMTEEDIAIAEEARGEPITVELDGTSYDVCMVASDPRAYDRFYNVIANPILWFVQHYLWDLSNAPDIRREEVDAWEHGYRTVNEDIARAVVEQIDGEADPLVMLHD
ncbi:MAG: trehalose-6-phosphate synthase, partial [Solirubrobacterales bacterium]